MMFIFVVLVQGAATSAGGAANEGSFTAAS
jgi:hypothetical protein